MIFKILIGYLIVSYLSLLIGVIFTIYNILNDDDYKELRDNKKTTQATLIMVLAFAPLTFPFVIFTYIRRKIRGY